MPYFPPLHFIAFTLFELVMKEDLAKEKGRESSHIYSLTMSWQRPLQYLEDGLQDVHFIVHKGLGREYLFDYKLPYN